MLRANAGSDSMRQVGYAVSVSRGPITTDAYRRINAWRDEWRHLDSPSLPVVLVDGATLVGVDAVRRLGKEIVYRGVDVSPLGGSAAVSGGGGQAVSRVGLAGRRPLAPRVQARRRLLTAPVVEPASGPQVASRRRARSTAVIETARKSRIASSVPTPPTCQGYAVAERVPADEADKQSRVQQHGVGVEPAPERQPHPQHRRHDHRSVRENHRHHEAKKHRMQRHVIRAVTAMQVTGHEPGRSSNHQPDVAGKQAHGHEPGNTRNPDRAARDVEAALCRAKTSDRRT